MQIIADAKKNPVSRRELAGTEHAPHGVWSAASLEGRH